MTDQEIVMLAEAWIAHKRSRDRDKETEPHGGYSDRSCKLYRAQEKVSDLELEHENPEILWKLILAIQHIDHSAPIQQILSAGLIENLLSNHGEAFIARIEAEAKRDPSFASTLGGVWKNSMTDEVWTRLKLVWDRRGWDDVPK